MEKSEMVQHRWRKTSPSSTCGSNPSGFKWTVKQPARFSWLVQEDSEHSASTVTSLYFTSFFTGNAQVMIKSQLNSGDPQLTRRQYLQPYNSCLQSMEGYDPLSFISSSSGVLCTVDCCNPDHGLLLMTSSYLFQLLWALNTHSLLKIMGLFYGDYIE